MPGLSSPGSRKEKTMERTTIIQKIRDYIHAFARMRGVNEKREELLFLHCAADIDALPEVLEFLDDDKGIRAYVEQTILLTAAGAPLWKPVSDPPKEECSTLVYTSNGKVHEARYYPTPNCWSGPIGKKAVLWAPLPKPPEAILKSLKNVKEI